MKEKMNRRTFTKTGAVAGAFGAAGLSAARAEKIEGSNDRLRIGMIGVGRRAKQLLDAAQAQGDAEVVAICDANKRTLRSFAGRVKGKPDQIGDFRKVLDRDDIDAVIIATPDHWHAYQTIMACRSGKDVYVEKPLSMTIREGRMMVDEARKNKRIVQVGTHRRSAKGFTALADLVKSGDLGKVTTSRGYRLSNMYPKGIGKLKPTAPPKDLDWDMWLGPRSEQAYQGNITPYKFRWWQNYSSQIGNWGVHYLDVIRWALDETGPSSICAMGGNFAVKDDRTIPDTMEAIYQFPCGHLAMMAIYEASGNRGLVKGDLEMRGTQGTVYIDSKSLEVVPERGGQFQSREPRMEPMNVEFNESNLTQTSRHMRNFFDCIKSRELPNADVEIGHRSTSLSLLANISYATQCRLEWDAENERVTNCDEANDLLHYEYRSKWALS